MNNLPAENILQLLRQTRTLLVLTVLMVFALDLIDPPYSSFGVLLNILVIVVLVFTLFRIHRSLVALKSSNSVS